MKLINSTLSFFLTGIVFIILFSGVLAGNSSCKSSQKNTKGPNTKDSSTFVKRVSWNILFKEKVGYKEKVYAIENIKDLVTKFCSVYNKAHGTKFIPKFDTLSWCPCDSTLFTLGFGLTNTSGGTDTPALMDTSGVSASTAPRGGGIRAQGGVLSISANNSINLPYKNPNNFGPILRHSVKLRNISPDPTKILAIIDSGIDTALFSPPIQNLIWKNPSGTTLHNFIPLEDVTDFSDKSDFKHGSAVAALAIDAMKEAKSYPRIMILKAVDKNDHGTIFSFSCALSYATQNHATVVNASLGYLGDEDPVLRKYIALASSNKERPIQLFFAAGNTPDMSETGICSNRNNNNQLGGTLLFYPACYSDRFQNITSVTQIQAPDLPCVYQYYSKVYVSLGVLTKNCCFFRVDFRNSASLYQGSSFATPVAAGIKMATIINTQDTRLTNASWEGLIRASSVQLTKDGKYIIY